MATKLTWINTEPLATSIEIRRSVDQVSWSLLATLSPSVTSYNDQFVHAPGVTYYYRINTLADDLCGGSVSVDVVQEITIPAPSFIRSQPATLLLTSFDNTIQSASSVTSDFDSLLLVPYRSKVRSPVISTLAQLALTVYVSRVVSVTSVESSYQEMTLLSFDAEINQILNSFRSDFSLLNVTAYDTEIVAPTSVKSDHAMLTFVAYDSLVVGAIRSNYVSLDVVSYGSNVYITTAIESTFEQVSFTVYGSLVSASGNILAISGLAEIDITEFLSTVTA